MATAAAEAGGWSGIRALVLDGRGRVALVWDPTIRAAAATNDNKDDNTRIGPLPLEEKPAATTTDDGPFWGDRAFITLEDTTWYL